jgi:hypothetical protein
MGTGILLAVIFRIAYANDHHISKNPKAGTAAFKIGPSGQLHGYKIGYSCPQIAKPPMSGAAYKPFKMLWCGREDLNLHEIAPASTSS